jgi:hypothetical protein
MDLYNIAYNLVFAGNAFIIDRFDPTWIATVPTVSCIVAEPKPKT